MFDVGIGITGRLQLDLADAVAFLLTLGFDNTSRLPINQEQVIHGTGVGGILPNRHTPPGLRIEPSQALHHPARRPKLVIDAIAGALFRALVD